jgi:hypothetical protein
MNRRNLICAGVCTEKLTILLHVNFVFENFRYLEYFKTILKDALCIKKKKKDCETLATTFIFVLQVTRQGVIVVLVFLTLTNSTRNITLA